MAFSRIFKLSVFNFLCVFYTLIKNQRPKTHLCVKGYNRKTQLTIKDVKLSTA